MRLAVCIPWRPTPDRVRPFDFVCGWYERNLPCIPIVYGDSGHNPFSRAGSRNDAVRKAQAVADTVVMADADTVPSLYSLKAAINSAGDGLLHFALDKMAYLDEAQTEVVYGGGCPAVEGSGHDSSAYVIRIESYWLAGGQDERFTGYGGEDGAFTMACSELLGPPVWHAGTALSLHHDGSCRDIGSERWQHDTAPLYRRYLDARGDPTAMRALIAERETM